MFKLSHGAVTKFEIFIACRLGSSLSSSIVRTGNLVTNKSVDQVANSFGWLNLFPAQLRNDNLQFLGKVEAKSSRIKNVNFLSPRSFLLAFGSPDLLSLSIFNEVCDRSFIYFVFMCIAIATCGVYEFSGQRRGNALREADSKRFSRLRERVARATHDCT